MEEKEKIRFRYFLDHKARDLTPEVKKIFLIEFDPDNQGKKEKELAKALHDKVLNTYRRLKSIMYSELGFQGKSRKREAYLHQLKREFSDSPSEQELKRLEIEGLNSLSQSLLLSHDQLGALLAAPSKDGIVKLWHLDGTVAQTFHEYSDEVKSLSFSPNSQMLASVSDKGTVKLSRLDGTLVQTLELVQHRWRGRDGKVVQTVQKHSYWVNSIIFSPDGQTLASASVDNTVKLWR